MFIPKDGCLLRLFIGESVKHGRKPLHEWIVLKARERGLAGATVLRGIMGYGANSRIHTSKILRLSADMPMIIEIVDSRENLVAFLAEIEGVIQEGLATLEKAEVHFYRSRH